MFQDFPEDNKNDDFLNEFRQKIADQSAASFEEKRNEMKRSKSVFIGAVSGVALAGIVGWFVLSPRYAINNPEEIPVIRRPQTAIKVQPSEPGGMEILNQDKSVYDIVEKKANEPTVENLLPPPEQPKLPVIEAQAPVVVPAPVAPAENLEALIADSNTPKVIKEAQKIMVAQEVSEDKVVTIKEASTETQAIVIPAKVETIKVDNSAKLAEKAAAKAKDWNLDENPEAPAPVALPSVPASTNVSASIPAGSWQVQLMSSQNKKAVEAGWNSMVKKYSVLKNQPHEIEAADLDFDGVFYRLKTGAFNNKADADSLCRDIKALGGTCIVKKK